MFRNKLILFLIFFSAACSEPSRPPEKKIQPVTDSPVAAIDSPKTDSALVKEKIIRPYSEMEKRILAYGLKDVSLLDSSIVVELRYSTTNNFIGLDMYGDFERCFLQPDVAEKLVRAQEALRKKHPGWSLIVYDAVRPVQIQRMMWDTVKLPRGEKQKYLSNPNNGSLHNYGAAVDVSIVDENGTPLDMGTPYDFFGEKAHPVKEAELLESGELTAAQIANRQILREAMRKGGFWGIQTEWWHFNSCTRIQAAEMYQIVE